MYKKLVRAGYKVKYHLSKYLSSLQGEVVPLEFDSIEHYAKWLYRNTQWKQDPIFGLLDYVQSVDSMWKQFYKNGKIFGDCDDLAALTASVLHSMGYKVYVVTINIRPGASTSLGHVIAVFKDIQGYYVFSNSVLYSERHKSTEHAILYNGFYRSEQILMYQISDWDLTPLETVEVTQDGKC